MVFTSITFLIYFLPTVLFLYFIVPKKHRGTRNLILLLSSLFFYFTGEPKAIIWMIISIFMNFLLGKLIGESKNKKARKIYLILSVIGNLGILAYFKYMNFFISNISSLTSISLTTKDIIMPIGISFYTFQGMSYVIDVYRKSVVHQDNILNVGLYISLFPQLIAGPIVRYETVAEQIQERNENIDKFFIGTARFIVGVGKKMLLANKFGLIADEIFALNGSDSITTYLAWFGSLAYAFQIFFDFSGYSDMAIGLGKMFGFDFEENFNYPYISKSITEFWRRWHISLGTWFRDYVYIPLGGNRTSTPRHIFNIFIVWMLTGFWHGASWNYIFWGLYFAVILLIEKYVLKKYKKRVPEIIKHIYAITLILIGWVIFRNENIGHLTKYMTSLVGKYGRGSFSDISHYLRQYYPEFIFGIAMSSPVFKNFEKGSKNIISLIFYGLIFILSLISILSSSFNPFIYFRF